MRQVLSTLKRSRFPSLRQWKHLPRLLTSTERLTLRICLGVGIASLAILATWYVLTHRAEVPAVGGTYTEAFIGEPRFINPLYASTSDADADLSHLIFSGLVRWDPIEGIVNDLAEEITISEDGKTYTVQLREDAHFHNGTSVRASDVLFTFAAVQNPEYRSPLAVSFRGITISQVDDLTVSFELTKAFAPFIASLSFGILPSELWVDIPAKNVPLAALNLEPIGSGPFKFKEFSKDKKGTILSYTLERNANFYDEKPFLETFTAKFYANAEDAISALDNRNVEGVAFVPPEQEDRVLKSSIASLAHPSIPLTASISFNQDKHAALKSLAVRQALERLIDREALVREALHGNGQTAYSPIPDGILGASVDLAKHPFDPGAAIALLEGAKFIKTEGQPYRSLPKDIADARKKQLPENADPSTASVLSVTITTVQKPKFVRTAELLKAQFEAAGIKTEIAVVPAENLLDSVVKPGAYEILLTETLTGGDPDPYPFWHSSQIGNGGLNLAHYANRNVDTLLEDARATVDPTVREAKYKEFQTILADEVPAVFLYRSTYAYAYASKLRDVTIDRILTPPDRFSTISKWFVKTKKVLK